MINIAVIFFYCNHPITHPPKFEIYYFFSVLPMRFRLYPSYNRLYGKSITANNIRDHFKRCETSYTNKRFVTIPAPLIITNNTIFLWSMSLFRGPCMGHGRSKFYASRSHKSVNWFPTDTFPRIHDDEINTKGTASLYHSWQWKRGMDTTAISWKVG